MIWVLRPELIVKVSLRLAVIGALAGCGGGSDGTIDNEPVNIAVSGIIDIEAGTRVDADNADALLAIRDPLTEPQSLSSEFLLAGYVSDAVQPGIYPPLELGAPTFQYFPDRVDRYQASLQSGLELTLQSFETRLGASSELVLRVEAPDGSEVGSETVSGNGAPVTIAVNTAQVGSYTISVTSQGTAPMLYILSSSRPELATAAAFDWPRHEFVENEAIVQFKAPTADAVQGKTLPSTALMVPGRKIAPGLWKVRRPETLTLSKRQSSAEQTLDWIRKLRTESSVLHASPNYRVQAFATPVDEPFYLDSRLPQQWHYSLINGPIAWQLDASGGAGVNVAVLDSGLFRSGGEWHPDFGGNVLPGFDAVDGDNLPSDPGNAVGGSVYHGTHVAGTVAAAVNSNGGAGVAFGAGLIPVRVLGEGGTGTLADLLEGMREILGGGTTARADVVNLSLGGLPCNERMVSDPSVAGSLQALINEGDAQGIIYVAAAGNSSTSQPSCPAALDNVLSVSAVDGAGNLASYSNFGSTIDLAAPGGDASRDGNGDGIGDLVSSTSGATVNGQLQPVYRGLQGTSMAAPHVSGVLALMKSEVANKDELTFADIEALLRSGQMTTFSCDPDCPSSELGYGLIDAGKALEAVLSGIAPKLLTSSLAVVNLATESGLAVSQTVELAPLGNYSISVDNITTSDPWFSVVQGSGPFLNVTRADPLQLELVLDPNQLEAGASVRGALDISYTPDGGSPNTLKIPVIGQRITDQQARDAGRHFVLLVEPDPDGGLFTTVAQTAARAENGQYRFEFIPDDGQAPELQNEVPPGNYLLVAGTDLDNDGVICHAGEACAEYPIAGLRQEITVSPGQPLTGLRMTTSYSRPTLTSSAEGFFPRPEFKGYQLMDRQGDPRSANQKVIQAP